MNVERKQLEKALAVVDDFIVDIKDMNPDIYQSYIGRNREQVQRNLEVLGFTEIELFSYVVRNK